MMSKDYKYHTEENISLSHFSLLNRILKLSSCLAFIRETRNAFKGTIGSTVRVIIDKEYDSITKEISNIPIENLTLIKLYSYLSGPIKERIIASTIVCNSISSGKLPSLINRILSISPYGIHQVSSITSKMIDSSISVLLTFIRNWTVYGVLNDPDNEFFIKKHVGKVDSELWWSTKYELVESLVPNFLIENNVIHQILVSGKSILFMRKHRDCFSSNFVDNFGSSAPFAVNYQQPKMKEVKPEIAWSGPSFELSMVPKFAEDSMKSLMYMIKQTVWIPGHLKTIQDFILFARGDFASALYQNFNDNIDEDPPTLLLQSINQVALTKNYTNQMTKEILTDRIDLKKKWTVQPPPDEISLVYLVNPPIDTFLGKNVLLNYELIGSLVWKLKCCEFKLGNNWSLMKRLQNLSQLGFKLRNMCLLRNLMGFVVRTVLEYLTTDIILCGWEELSNELENAKDLDNMIKSHRIYLERIMEGALQTPAMSVRLKMLTQMLNVISEFSDVVDEVEAIYDSIVQMMKKSKIFAKNNVFGEKAKELRDVSKRVNDLYRKFETQLSQFYIMSFNEIKSKALEQLEARFRFCVENIQ
ncbi:Gamma-tubulin complex component 3 [Histomonas meleagridis]|uniref:Gamma-tubulin complex component 3 n=1 Tax=Histomonas meleagridis TaxID=135588 RepID=UPI003559A221|nr:Gamma-tubulin complex component 3 [Histomonas meleagridis]KAH0802838.1 Gamma-tubulin complex component 3 [Histomonas meleagridis]